jgi:hypothetical protein
MTTKIIQYKITQDKDTDGSFKFTRIYVTTEHGNCFQVHAQTKIGQDGAYSEGCCMATIENFKKTDKKAFQDYCGGENKQHDVLGFIEWVISNGYTFDKERTQIYKYPKIKGVWNFSGNLHECSSAFNFDIFDSGLIAEIVKKLKNNIK